MLVRDLKITVFALLIIGCSKTSPVGIQIPEFIGKYLICDSVKIIDNSSTKVIVKGKGTGLDIRFDSASVLTVYSNPQKEFYYGIRYSKIYFWPKNVNMHEGDYYKIGLKEGRHLNLEHKDLATGKIDLFYFSIE
jgi:hypothetical protein